ncbi:MAG: type II toxin-antitoxin system Phd/YefM family antitoxin [Carboxydocellales bacterium]
MAKPTFTREQVISASHASKHFGDLRKRAKDLPQFISDNGDIDTVVLAYEYYEKLYLRLTELEALEEARVLSERVESLDQNPSSAVSWKSIRRSGQR